MDITQNSKYETYPYRCLAPMPYRKYRYRQDYLEKAVHRGFHKKLLVFDKEVVGQIEYAPAEVSGYPITGHNVIVMNCIWVLRKAKWHNFGALLLENMIRSEGNATGFATIALDDHWSPWFKRWQMEKFGLKPIDSIVVKHKTKHTEQGITIYLMWLPTNENAKPPNWDKHRLLEGETFCMAHPLYRPQKWKGKVFEAKQW